MCKSNQTMLKMYKANKIILTECKINQQQLLAWLLKDIPHIPWLKLVLKFTPYVIRKGHVILLGKGITANHILNIKGTDFQLFIAINLVNLPKVLYDTIEINLSNLINVYLAS